MEHLDIKTLIHAGVEIIAFGGLVFWTNKRISGLSKEIIELRSKVAELEKIVGSMHQFLTRGIPTQDIRSRRQLNPDPNQDVSEEDPDIPDSKLEEDPDLTDEDLDSILADEVASLKSKKRHRRKKRSPAVICDGDTCRIVNEDDLKKSHEM